MKTKEEILKETIEFYTHNPRAYNEKDKICVYRTEEGVMCAVGRCIDTSNPDNERYFDVLGSVETLTYEIKYDPSEPYRSAYGDMTLDTILAPEYHGHSRSFWNDVQQLHDLDEYWTADGLSSRGRDRVNALAIVYDLSLVV